jgi:hypothetical protein
MKLKLLNSDIFVSKLHLILTYTYTYRMTTKDFKKNILMTVCRLLGTYIEPLQQYGHNLGYIFCKIEKWMYDLL